MVPIASAASNNCGISGESSSASAFASAGVFNGKLRVKWFWLIMVSLVGGFGDCDRGVMLFLGRHLRRSEVESQLVDGSGEAERKLITIIDPRAGIEAYVEGLVDRHHKRNRVRDRFLGQLLAIN